MTKMIPVTPYIAQYEASLMDGLGNRSREWRSCRVLGVTMLDDEPSYVAEIYHGDTSSLMTLPEVKRIGTWELNVNLCTH